ncbi:MAG: NAD(P)H-hydrate dehydratase [Gammaproteobacteria bacterium]|nr:NAD(P)H-hydrate dehydratase [Gammaproteobacteria bacterium]
MKIVDEETIKRFCPGLELMERAGREVAQFILERFPKQGFKASIFVGPGNNGGDALVVARHLSEEGRACSLHYMSSPEDYTMDALKNYHRVQQRLGQYRKLREINSTRPDWVSVVQRDFADATVVVDGLFGTGLSRSLEGRAAEIVTLINSSRLPVVSIDIPSGIHSDTGEVLGQAVRATYTITMGCPKVGMLFHPGKSYVGELEVADIGFPDEVVQANSLGMYLLDREDASRRLPARPPSGHKYEMGVVLLVAGSRAYTGAAVLAAEAALRSGCGMVYVAVPEGIRQTVQIGLREAIVIPLPETVEGTIAVKARSALENHLEKADVLVVGPGLTTHEETVRFVIDLVGDHTRPLVLDADGINAFVGKSDRLPSLAPRAVVTPHSGELGRVLASDIPRDPLKRIELTRQTARSWGVTIVHKGAPTLIASAEGDVWVNYHGSSALATAGSGDVLAGVLGGLLAQHSSELDAACVACFLHGRAAEFAAGEVGLRSVIAGDLLRYLGGPLLELEHTAN